MSDKDEWSKIDRPIVENYAAGRRRDDPYLGRAKVELLQRDHDYAEAQERSRRKYEDERAAARRDFDEQLTQRQMDHASKIAEQLDTAKAAAKAAKWAAGAALAAAFGAIAPAVFAAVKYLQ